MTNKTENYTPRYKTLYKDQVLPALMKEMKVKSPMAAPKLEKIVVNLKMLHNQLNYYLNIIFLIGHMSFFQL